MLQALVYLHRRGVIHHDLKPANVLVTAAGSVKVMDFGLAFQHDASVQLGAGVAGTLHYMAPELFSEVPASVASDLYAVGVILYELFVGQPPFTSKNLPSLITSILSREPDLSLLPLYLAPVVERLLAKSPEERYANAKDVIQALCAATHTPLPIESQVLRDSFLQASRFVGREAELTTLKEALDAAFTVRGSFWLIGGESGVGKSRLLDEVRSRALVRGAMVLRGQAIAEGGLPYELWREIIRRLALEIDVSDLEAGIFKPLVPDIATLLERDIPDVANLPADARQERLSLTLIDVLKRQMETQPMVLLLEDLQWAAESLAMLRQMLLVHEQLPNLLMIGTYRDDERPSLTDELVGMQTLKLTRLNEEAIKQLARSMLGEAGAQPAVVELLQRETEGNVFFMVETVRSLAEEAGALTAIRDVTLPQAIFAHGIQRVVQRRLNQLPATWQVLLQRAAVAGRGLDLTLLRHLADGLDIDMFLTAGLNASVLEVIDQRWRFSHDKLREGVLTPLSEEERRGINRVVALAIEASYPDDTNYYEVLMGHWQVAGDIERELYYLLPVTHHMTKLRADYEGAIHCAARGLTLLDESDAQRVLLLTLSSEAHHGQGHIADAKELAQQGFVLARSGSDHKGMAESLRCIGDVAKTQGDSVTAYDVYQQSQTLFQEINDKQGIAASLNSLSNTAIFRGEYVEADNNAQQSLALFRDIRDKRGSAESLNNLGISALYQGNAVAAHDYFQQVLELSQDIGDKRGVATGLNFLGVIADRQGNYTLAQSYYQQSLALRREIGNKQGVAQSLHNLSAIASAQADFTAAHDYAKQGLALRRELGDKQGTALSLNTIGYYAFLQGDSEMASDYTHQALALRREISNKSGIIQSLCNLGYIARAQGDYTAALDFHQQSLALANEIGAKEDIVEALTLIAAVYLDQGVEDSESVLREALQLNLAMGIATSTLLILTVLARLYVKRGRLIPAAELGGLVDTHPSTDVYIRGWELIKLKHELQGTLTEDELALALKRGKMFDLETIVRGLLAQSWK